MIFTSIIRQVNSFFVKTAKLIKENKIEAVAVFSIIFLGAFLRLFKISEYMTFLGDEGRDVILVRRLIAFGDIILVGPGTSIGNMYLGPLYYYLMSPALLLSNFSPVGPAVMVALFGIATIYLVWLITREWFGRWPAIFSALFYSLSPVVIVYSRSSWNPNIMPFFALLAIYGMYKTWKDSGFGWLIIAGISFAFVLQSHYLGLLLFPTIGILWLLSLRRAFEINSLKKFFTYSLLSIFIFAFLMSPLVIFDARHSWRNFAAMKEFFSKRQETVSVRPWSSLPKIPQLAEKITVRLVAGTDKLAGKITSIIAVILITWFLLIKREGYKDKKLSAYLILFLWLGFSLIGMGLYKQEIYDHYYGFFFPAPFILFSGLVFDFIDSVKVKIIGLDIFKILAILTGLVLLYVNLINSPIRYSPNRQMQRSIEVVERIKKESNGEMFNFAVIAERNYEGAYQYFLEKDNAKFAIIDAQRTETVAKQLFVICEMPENKCDPTHNSKAEIANFGWSKIDKVFNESGTTIFKLVHSK